MHIRMFAAFLAYTRQMPVTPAFSMPFLAQWLKPKMYLDIAKCILGGVKGQIYPWLKTMQLG